MQSSTEQQILDQLNRIEKMLSQLLGTQPIKPIEESEGYQKHTIESVECYTSKSGNRTYKAWDTDGKLIYLRQSHKDLLVQAKLWDELESMNIDDECPCSIVLYTVPDGDFLKPVKIESGGMFKTLGSETDKGINQELSELKRIGKSGDYVILDTETTDLKGYVCQLSILAPNGDTLLNTLIKPPFPISKEASNVHGITNDMVEDAPELIEISNLIASFLDGKKVIGWNVGFDRDSLIRTAKATNLG